MCSSLPIARVDIYSSFDPDLRARFWRDADAEKNGDAWEAKLPLRNTNQPLLAFAHGLSHVNDNRVAAAHA